MRLLRGIYSILNIAWAMYIYDEKIINKINRPWSDIRSMLPNNIAYISIFLAIFGNVIIFNSFIDSFIEKIPIIDHVDIKFYNSMRIKLVYFGLVFVGFGSALYIVFSPKIIRMFDSRDDCEKYYEDSKSKIQGKIMLNEVVNCIYALFNRRQYYHKALHSDEYISVYDILPRNVAIVVDGTLEIIAKDFEEECCDANEGKAEKTEKEDIIEDVDDFFIGITPTGYPYFDIRRFLDIMYNRIAADKYIWIEIDEIAEQHKGDIAKSLYSIMDVSNPSLRFIIFYFILSGYIFLFIPSLYTFYLVLKSIFQ